MLFSLQRFIIICYGLVRKSDALYFLLDIFIQSGTKLYKQIVGIRMGTVSPLLQAVCLQNHIHCITYKQRMKDIDRCADPQVDLNLYISYMIRSVYFMKFLNCKISINLPGVKNS